MCPYRYTDFRTGRRSGPHGLGEVIQARRGLLGPRRAPPYRAGLPLAAALAAAAMAAGFSAWADAEASEAELLGCGTPSFLRSAVSTFWQMSLFSFKKIRAFSRPWPMRSPPNPSHAPDFSMTP